MASHDRPAAAAGGPVWLPSPPATPPLDQLFDEDGLYALRAAVAAHAAHLGASELVVDDLVVIANELASNAIRHGGGTGRLRLWRTGRSISCEVTDTGDGLADPDTAGHERPQVAAYGGRGLWVVRQMTDRIDIRTGPDGTAVTAVVNLR
jgi:anti-sigma regulatory factor (Ser/Thr protein kinase)